MDDNADDYYRKFYLTSDNDIHDIINHTSIPHLPFRSIYRNKKGKKKKQTNIDYLFSMHSKKISPEILNFKSLQYST